jgi:hypothetical protein
LIKVVVDRSFGWAVDERVDRIMRMNPASVLAPLWLLALSSPLVAQTTTTYEAPAGHVSPSLQITMNLTGGGSVLLNPVVGPNCYLGMTCGFPAGYVGTSMTYALPDGSTAILTNFEGTFLPLGSNNYAVGGQASGTDSQSRNVTVENVRVTMRITCRSGRGGGCVKAYTGGTLTVTVNDCGGPCATMAPTSSGTPTQTQAPSTPTVTESTCVGSCHGEDEVTVNDIILMVNIALGTAPLSACPAEAARRGGQITVTEIVAAVNSALNGCQ